MVRFLFSTKGMHKLLSFNVCMGSGKKAAMIQGK